MIFQNFQTFRLLIFGRLVLIHCMTHCIMQYIHISWPSLDFPCSSILRVDGSGFVESYGACMAVICRVWVLVLTAWRYIARRGSDGLPARSAESIQPAPHFFLQRRKDYEIFQTIFQPFVESSRFWFLSAFWDPWAVFRPRTRKTAKARSFFRA